MFKKKLYRVLMSVFCITAVLSVTGAVKPQAAPAAVSSSIRIYGPVTKGDSSSYLHINNVSGESYAGDIRLTLSEETRILDAVTGYPVAYENIRDGETAYVYIGPAMTMSLPPMTHASMVLVNIPADYRVPEYLTVDTLTLNADGTSGSINASNGTTYDIPSDSQVIPYLTRQFVTIRNLTKGTTCLLWSNSKNQAHKIVIFADEESGDPQPATGWVDRDSHWYYYDENGGLFTGWLKDNDDWYYLEPDTGIMQTGFITLEGKTYFLQENGKMLTKAKTFTPDENGVLSR